MNKRYVPTAVEWLEAIAPVLERIAAEERAEALLHDAHVIAWLDAPCCPCGTIIAKGKECAACRADREPALSLFEYCGR